MYVVQAKEILALRRSITAKRPTKRVRNGKTKSVEPVVDLHALNTAAKLADVWTKLMRQIHACATAREHEAIVARRDREKREIERGAGH